MHDADDDIEAILDREDEAPPANMPDPRDILHPGQLPVYDCEAQERVVLGGRRWGKSVLLIAFALQAAMAFSDPDIVVVLITRTAKNARRDVWPVLKLVLRWLGFHDGVKRTNEGMLECSPVPGGPRVVLGGCETLGDVELWRGTKVARAIIDECGAFPDPVLRQLCVVLEPGLADVGGDIIKAGNPGYAMDPTSHWFQLTGHLRASGDVAPGTPIPVFHGNMFGNPHMLGGDSAKLAAFAAQVREKNGWTEDSPTYQREWDPGKWVQDSSELVYPFSPERNGVAELPYPVDDGGWAWVIAADIGNVEESGIIVMGAHRFNPYEYVVHSEKEAGMLTSRLAERIIDIKRTYPRATVVVDTGGMGKQHAHEISARFGIASIPADKRDRESNVRLTHEGYVVGSIKVLDGPQCDAVRREDSLLRWNKEHTDHDKQQCDPKTGKKMDHIADARLYARQWLHKYGHRDAPVAHRLGTREFYQAQEAEIIAALESQLKTGGADPWDN